MTQPILIWAAGGMHLLSAVDAAIGKALQNRGYKVFAVVCDGTYKACILRNISVNAPIELWGDKETNEYGTSCEDCKRKNAKPFAEFNIPFAFMSDFIEKNELYIFREMSRKKIEQKISDINLEKHVNSSVTRFLQGANLLDYPEINRLFEEYRFSSLVSLELVKNIIKNFKPYKLIMSHGIYVDWGIALEYSLKHSIPVIIWQEGYLKSFFYFYSPADIYHTHPFTCQIESWQRKIQETFTPIKKQRLDNYLVKRYVYNKCMDLKTLPAINESSLYLFDTAKPIWCLFAHLTWDASGERTKKIYPTYAEWIIETFKIIKDIKDVFWMIKPHPAEKWYQTRVGVEELIKRTFSSIPDHIIILKPDVEINPFLLYKKINGAITIGSTSGIESAYHGKPVITAGESYYSDKGFTFDAKTELEYKILVE